MITLAQLRRRNLLTITERLHLRNVNFDTVICTNSIGERVSICHFHKQEFDEMIKELEKRVYTEADVIYEKSGRTIAYTLATLISFRIRLGRKEVVLKSLPHHENFNKPKTDKQTYLLLDQKTGYYKIGRSNNPLNREKTLQSEKPTIILICTCLVNIEKELHKAYKYLRIRGEWFQLANIDVENIKKYFFLKDKEAKLGELQNPGSFTE